MGLFVRSALIAVRALWTAAKLGVFDTTAVDAEDLVLRKLVVKWTRVEAAGVADDAAEITWHFVGLEVSGFDDFWTTAKYQACEAAFDTFWGVYASKVASNWTLAEYRWYRVLPTEMETGPPLRVTSRNVAGTATTTENMPPQVCVTATLKTALPKHWGRVYLPFSATNAGSAYGRLASGQTTAIGDAVRDFLVTCSAADAHPVVFSRTLASALSIEAVQVDDLFDVQRRRRYRRPTTRAIYNTTS